MPISRTLPELGHIIQSHTNSMFEFFNEAKLPQPTLSQEASIQAPGYPKAIQDSRAELLEALDELRTLILGPTSYLYFNTVLSPSWTAIFNVLYRYRIAQHVPVDGAVTFDVLAARCGLDESDVRRIVRAAISLRIFEEDDQGFVTHNAISRALTATLTHDGLGFFTEEYMPAALKLPEALRRFPGSDRAGESAVALANGSDGDRDIFSVIASDEARVKRLANAMSFMTTIPETSFSNFVDSVPWSPLITQQGPPRRPECPKVVVDVGGSQGDLLEALLRRYPEIERAIVEDLPEVTRTNVERGPPGGFSRRIQYQAYDFFTEQVIKDADVYIFSNVFHDWSDSYAVQMLRNQIPALKPGSRILINDICIETKGVQNSFIRQAQWGHDLCVKMAMNAKERTREEWAELLSTADQRFHIESIVTPRQAVHSVIEVTWRG
ncbi:Sterigmatocystin 8-O-methyltransferase [Cytospora mali]|uniref:Sterigmatocystin 8-O-methyltransferase n=1 Tax=Cytospora mali TaxID=578113 RepID=A0A194WC07_CYTMA|nr:Sterigmatocystin 8-O-methyltransferase [Valsa mali]